MGGGCGPNCTTFTLNVPLSSLSDEELESIRESIIALLQGLGAGKVTVSFREGSTKAYASMKFPVNEETLNGKVTEAGAIQTLGDSKFIIAQINGKATEYNNKLIIVKTDNDIEYIDDVGDPEVVQKVDWTTKGITENEIKHVAFGKNVKTIGNYAFTGCASLASITFPEGVTTIGYRAFRDCTSLASITLPEGVTTIGGEAFQGCTSLASITIPVGVTTIGYRAFSGCISLTAITVDEGNPNYLSDQGVLFNKAQTLLILYPPGNIRTVYRIPEGVTTIEDGAFFGCTSLASVTIPVGVTTIQVGAFSGCISLTAITVDEGNPNYLSDQGVLFNKAQTLLILYPPGNIRTVYRIPEGVTTIGQFSFTDCTSLASVILPEGVTTIITGAFLDCTSLVSVNIPKSVDDFTNGENFVDCVKLEIVTFEGGRDEDVELKIGMFKGCVKLAAIDLPEKVLFDIASDEAATSIFEGCTSLAKVTVRDPRVVEYLDSAFKDVPAVQVDTLDFNVANELDGELSFGAENGAFSDLSGDDQFTFGGANSGGDGVRTVAPI